MSDDPHAHIVISYARFMEWRERRRQMDAELKRRPPPTNDADQPPLPHDPPQPEATAWRPK